MNKVFSIPLAKKNLLNYSQGKGYWPSNRQGKAHWVGNRKGTGHLLGGVKDTRWATVNVMDTGWATAMVKDCWQDSQGKGHRLEYSHCKIYTGLMTAEAKDTGCATTTGCTAKVRDASLGRPS